MKRIISISIFLVALLALPACTDDLFLGNTVTGSYTPQGEPVDAYLDLTVSDLQIDVTTRATADEIEDTEAERRVNDIWLFEYDAKTGNLIDEPQYIEIKDQSELTNLPVTISNTDGEPVLIYVVANSGNSTWANTGDNFNSLAALKKHVIFNPAPIRIDGEGGETETTLSIPMGGSVGEDSSLAIVGGEKITVPVKRMFAKLYVHVAILKGGEGTEDIDASLSNFYIERIASTSTVETTYNTDGSWYTPEATRYDVSRYFPANNYPGNTDEQTGTTTYGPFVLYVPENIQGEAQKTSDGSVAPPADALRLTTGITATIDNGEVSYSPSYVACPGSWNATLNNQEYGENFNINRNTIYDIQVNITVKEDDLVTPSANCIIAPPGVTTAFYPYVRDEEPSAEMMAEWTSELEERYSFTTYLDPSDDPSKTGAKVIRGLKIIWQTEGCIGDNSGYDLVWMDPVPSETVTGDARTSAERHRKIYVRPKKEGNALIAAYDDENCEGNILWSWHIWATNLPIEADAIEYYHYNWDSNGINTDQFVAGPLVMMCNLGALAERPTTAGVLNTDTYGMLYQWGRKDPFPPIKTVNNGTSGQAQKGGQTFYDYADATIYVRASQDYTVEIGVYDNSNKQINLSGYSGALGSSSPNGDFYTDAPSNIPALGSATAGTLSTIDNEVILQSVRHPTMFIAASNRIFTSTSASSNDSSNGANSIGSYYNSGDWLPENDDFLWGGGHPGTDELQVYSQDNNVYDEYNQRYRIDAYLENDYGPNKQIFDPCPYGWRVSSGEIWLGFTYDGKNWGNNGDEYTNQKWDKINCADEGQVATVNTQCGFTFYMQGWRTGVTSFFPLQPARSPSGQPYLLGGICGNYHNATVDREYHLSSWASGVTIRRVDILHLHAESTVYGLVKPFTNELYYYTKAVAGPLRCVRDTK